MQISRIWGEGSIGNSNYIGTNNLYRSNEHPKTADVPFSGMIMGIRIGIVWGKFQQLFALNYDC